MNSLHIFLLIVCWLVVMGDFFTTTYALNNGTGTEGNPLMGFIVGSTGVFLLSKVAFYGFVVACTHVLRDNPIMSYLPAAIVILIYAPLLLSNVYVCLYGVNLFTI